MTNCNSNGCSSCSGAPYKIVKEDVKASVSIEAKSIEDLETGISELSASFKSEGFEVLIYGRGTTDSGMYTASLAVTRVKGCSRG